MKRKFFTIAMAAAVASYGLTSCSEEAVTIIKAITTILSIDGKGLGWLEDEEDTESIEDDIIINPGDNSPINNNTTKVDLSSYMPKVGDQGNFGTCVAWATAYHARTYLNARSKGLSRSQLNESNSFSAGDLYQNIPGRGSKCAGAVFQAALDQLVKRGVATEAYGKHISKVADCDCNSTSSATQNANKYKIKSYREINIKDVKTVKRYLNEGRAIIFGAQLGDNFMKCNSAAVLSSHGGFKNTGMHANHAMVCVGYDDSKGANGAFRVLNSWGETWGDKGYCWIDYDFFTKGEGGDKHFVFCGFVMYALDEDVASMAALSNSNIDLIPSKCTDVDFNDPDDIDSDDPTWRSLMYDVYNAGSATVESSKSWSVCYLLYNAYKASEYQIVLFDFYSDLFPEVEKGTMVDDWDSENAFDILGVRSQGYAVGNYDLEPGKTLAETVSGVEGDVFEWTYKLPSVSGKYYLVLMADVFNSVEESNKDNNFHFLTAADGGPLTIENGVIKDEIGNNKVLTVNATTKPRQNAEMPNQTAVNSTAPNTYSPGEIANMLIRARESGELRNKAMQWSASKNELSKPRKFVKSNKQ